MKIPNPFAKAELKRDFIETFSTPHGQRVLAAIMRDGGVTDPVFTSDHDMLLIFEGQRRLAHSIFKQVHGSMNPLLKQIAEQIELAEQNPPTT